MRKRFSGFAAALAAIAIMLACLSALLGFLLWRQEAQMRPETVSKVTAIGRTIADQVGQAVEYGIPLQSLRGMDEFLRSLAAPDDEILYVAVTATDGTRLYGLGLLPAAFDPAGAEVATRRRDDFVDVAVPILADQMVAGSVHLGMREGHHAAMAAIIGSLATLATAAFLSLIVVLAFTRRHVDRPLGRVRRILDDLAQGGTPAPAELDAVGEMAELGATLDGMLERLAAKSRAFRLDMRELALAQAAPETRQAMESLAARAEKESVP